MSEFCRAFEILFGFVIHLSYGCEYEEGVCVVYMIQYQNSSQAAVDMVRTLLSS